VELLELLVDDQQEAVLEEVQLGVDAVLEPQFDLQIPLMVQRQFGLDALEGGPVAEVSVFSHHFELVPREQLEEFISSALESVEIE